MAFEDEWRDWRKDWRTPEAVLKPSPSLRGRLERIVRGVPEVFVRVTGRPRTLRALSDHLRYISRDGQLAPKDQQGLCVKSREAVADLAEGWAFTAGRDSRSRSQTPVALSIVFGLPPGHDPEVVERASQHFMARAFEGHDFLLVMHTDRPHPHAHVVVRWLGKDGRRLPSHRNVALGWREKFAEEVRALGVEVEASPRWARGVIRRRYPYSIHLMREAARAGHGPIPKADVQALRLALAGMAAEQVVARPLEVAAARKQLVVRQGYLDLADRLRRSSLEEDRAFARRLARFVQQMPPPLAPRLEYIRALELKKERTGRAPGRERVR